MQIIAKEKIDFLMPLPMDDIMQTFIHYIYEAENDSLSEGAMNAITEAVIEVPELIAPYVVDILKRADQAIRNTTVVIMASTFKYLPKIGSSINSFCRHG